MDGRAGLGPYLSLWVFGLAFGFVEAAVVIYLRQALGIGNGELFPVLQAIDPVQQRLFGIERLREGVTLILMLAPALLFSGRLFERFLAYVVVFGIWDLAYYGFLWIYQDWPSSWLTYDVLFMIPTLWVAPVLCAVLVSAALIVFGTACLLIANRRMARNPNFLQWLVALVGGTLVLFSFLNNASYYLAGGMPPRFSWPLFVSGYGLAAIAGIYFLVQFIQQPKTRFF